MRLLHGKSGIAHHGMTAMPIPVVWQVHYGVCLSCYCF